MDDDTDPEPGDSDAYVGSAADLMSDAAEALCDSMFRCCDDDAQAWFFQAWRDNTPWLTGQRTCRRIPIESRHLPRTRHRPVDRTWLGAGSPRARLEKSPRPRRRRRLLDELRTADCGESLRDALIDRTCFSVSAPSGGDEQRRFLAREAFGRGLQSHRRWIRWPVLRHLQPDGGLLLCDR